jgi:hypothetical protein
MSAQPNAVPIEQITPNVLQLARLAARSKDNDKIKYDRALAQLRQLVENANGQDGAYWQWSWTAFCRGFPERGILSITQVLKQHQSSSSNPGEVPAQRRPAEEPAVDRPPVQAEVGAQPKAEERDYSKETIELLTTRARALLRKEKDARLSAGYVLIELKKRITDKSTTEGQPWNWSWRTYVAGDPDSGIPAMLERTVRDADRLISYVKSDDPAATIARTGKRRLNGWPCADDGVRRTYVQLPHRRSRPKRRSPSYTSCPAVVASRTPSSRSEQNPGPKWSPMPMVKYPRSRRHGIGSRAHGMPPAGALARSLRRGP